MWYADRAKGRSFDRHSFNLKAPASNLDIVLLHEVLGRAQLAVEHLTLAAGF